MEKAVFSNVQLELLKMFHHNIPEKQLLEIKNILAKYFAAEVSHEMNDLWEKNNWGDATMEEWAKQHMRKNK